MNQIFSMTNFPLRRLLISSFALALSTGSALAVLDVVEVKKVTGLSNGVAYPLHLMQGRVEIAPGVFVDPTGSRAFYGENRLPNSQEEWDQLIADISRGGPGVSDFLNTHFADLMNSPYAPDLVGAVNQGLATGTGMLEATAMQWLTNAFGEVVNDSSRGGPYNFSELNLQDYDLTNANLTNLGLTAAQLSGAGSLTGANLADMNLTGFIAGDRDFTNTNFDGTNLTGSVWTGVANFGGLDFGGANLYGANFGGRDLTGVNLAGANLAGANFTGARSDTDTGGDFSESYNRGSAIYGVGTGTGNWTDDYVPPFDPEQRFDYGPWELVGTTSRSGRCFRVYERDVWSYYPNVVGSRALYGTEEDEVEYTCPPDPCEDTGGPT